MSGLRRLAPAEALPRFSWMYSASRKAPMIQTARVVITIVGKRSIKGSAISSTRLFKPRVGPVAKVLYAKGTETIINSGGCTIAVKIDLFWTTSAATRQPIRNIVLKNIVSSVPARASTI